MRITSLFLAGLLALLSVPTAFAQHLPTGKIPIHALGYRLSILARTGDPVPDQPNSVFVYFFAPTLADNGDLAFSGSINDPSQNVIQNGIFTQRSGALTSVALTGNAAPGMNGQQFTDFGRPSINSQGQVSYLAEYSNQLSGIYLNGNLIAHLDGAVPGVPGARFNILTDPSLDENGLAVFSAGFINQDSTFGGGVFTQQNALYFDNTPIPGLPGVSVISEGNVVWQGSGNVIYYAGLSDGTSALLQNNSVVWRSGTAAPQTPGNNFVDFDSGVGGDAQGDMAYLAYLDDGTSAVYVNNHLIAQQNGPLPGSAPGLFYSRFIWNSLGDKMLDSNGNVVFTAMYNTGYGTSDVGSGVFLNNTVVALSGQMIGGPSGETLAYISGPASINKNGQIVFIGGLEDGSQAIIMATRQISHQRPGELF